MTFKEYGSDGLQVASGRFHAGFLSRADCFPLDKVLDDEEYNERDLVFCGHSLGGAIATVVALRAKIRLEQIKKGGFMDQRRVTCITFGAPLVGDEGLRSFCQMHGLAESFFHFVNQEVHRARINCYRFLV